MPQLAEAAAPNVDYLAALGREIDERARLEELWELPAYAPELPRAVRVQDLPEEAAIQHEFEKGLGALAVGQMIKQPEAAAEPARLTILDQMEWAARGDKRALKKNALFVLSEGILSEGVAESDLTRDEQGRLAQHGHPMYDVLRTAIERHPGEHEKLHAVTRNEGRNLYTIETLDRAGYFDAGYVWVVPRIVPKSVPAGPLRRYGYFENLAVAWGVVWKRPDGTFTMRSVFTAGTVVEDHEESATGTMTAAALDQMIEARLSRRHDIGAVEGVYEKLGLPVPEDTIGFHRGFIRHRDEFAHPDDPNADIARLYDDQLGPDYFMGAKGERQDYVAYGRNCIASMQQLEPATDALVDEFMELYYGKVDDEMVVTRLLAKHGRHYAIDYVIDHPEVSARPLGLSAANARVQYYEALRSGDTAGAGNFRKDIHRKSRVNMCGHDTEDDAQKDGSENSGDTGSSMSSTESCRIHVKLCYCCGFDSNGRSLGYKLELPAEIDVNGTFRCLRPECGAWRAKDGKRFDEGRIVERARQEGAED